MERINQPTLLLECVVGSQLHGTSTPESDTDIRRVQASPLVDLLSPFGAPGTTSEGWTGDLETHEFQRFVKLLAKCNMTAMEILWSDMIRYEHPVMQIVRKQRHIFLDAERLYKSARGYAHSQLIHIDQTMTIGTSNTDSKRAGKFAAAYIRVLSQAAMLLLEGHYAPGHIGLYKNEIIQWKRQGLTQQDYRRFNHIGKSCEAVLTEAYEMNSQRFTQDTNAIMQLTRDVYVTIEEERYALVA